MSSQPPGPGNPPGAGGSPWPPASNAPEQPRSAWPPTASPPAAPPPPAPPLSAWPPTASQPVAPQAPPPALPVQPQTAWSPPAPAAPPQTAWPPTQQEVPANAWQPTYPAQGGPAPVAPPAAGQFGGYPSMGAYQPFQPATPLSKPLAGAGRRVVAYLVDLIVVGLVVGVLIGIAAATGSNAVTVLAYVIGIAVALFYRIGFEATSGQTPGKRWLGIRVVKADGGPMTWGAAIVRNLLWIVDGLFSNLVGFLLVAFNAKKQRVGDMAASTQVIREA